MKFVLPKNLNEECIEPLVHDIVNFILSEMEFVFNDSIQTVNSYDDLRTVYEKYDRSRADIYNKLCEEPPTQFLEYFNSSEAFVLLLGSHDVFISVIDSINATLEDHLPFLFKRFEHEVVGWDGVLELVAGRIETFPSCWLMQFSAIEKFMECLDNDVLRQFFYDWAIKEIEYLEDRPRQLLTTKLNKLGGHFNLCLQKKTPVMSNIEPFSGGGIVEKVQWHGTFEQLVTFWGYCSDSGVGFIKQKDTGVDWELLQKHFEVVKKDGKLADVSNAGTKFASIKEKLEAQTLPSQNKKTKSMKCFVVDLLKGVVAKLDK